MLVEGKSVKGIKRNLSLAIVYKLSFHATVSWAK